MSVTAYLTAGTLTQGSEGGFTWSNPANARVADGVYAAVVCTASSKSSATASNSLQWTNFDFSGIPSGSTIVGIEAEDKVYASINDPNSGYGDDKTLYLRYNGSNVGNNMISAVNWPVSPGEVRTYGSSTNMWGTTLTRDQIASSTFGIYLQVAANATMYIDYFKIRVYYYIAPPLPVTNVTATENDTSKVIISWEEPFNNAAVTGYKVFRNGTSITTPTTSINGGKPLSITDGGLEIWTSSSVLTNWTFGQDGTGGSLAKETGPSANVKEGTYSAKVTVGTAASYIYTPNITITGGVNVTIGGWVKSANTSASKVAILVYTNGTGGRWSYSYYQNSGSWEYLVCNKTVPADATYMVIQVRVITGATAVAYFDMISGVTGTAVWNGYNGLKTINTYNDTTAAAPVITPGSTVASDGTYTDKVALSLTGNSISNGTQYTYTVTSALASLTESANTSFITILNPGFETWSDASTCTNWGFYQAGTGGSCARESTIKKAGTYSLKITCGTGQTNVGQNIETLNSHTIEYWKGKKVTFGAWVYAVNPSNFILVVWDGVASTNSTYHPGGSIWTYLTVTHTVSVTATLVQIVFLANTNGAVGYIDTASTCEGTAVWDGADSLVNSDTGYRLAGTVTYQWQRSDGDSDAAYNTNLGTTASYDDTTGPANAVGRYYRCVENATGSTQVISAVNRGYRMIAGHSAVAKTSTWNNVVDAEVAVSGQEQPVESGYVVVNGVWQKWWPPPNT